MANKKIIQALFEEHAHHFPNYVAALKGNEKLTYGELNQRANQLAHYLQSSGLKPDIPVALCVERSFDFLITLIAILKAGGAYLPLDASQPKERLLFLLQDSQAPILITKSTFRNQFTSYQGTVILLDQDDSNINKQPTENLPSANTSEHLAYIIYTSGSTGTPKGVLIEHRSVINYCKWFSDYTGCKPQQRIDFSANPIFDMSVTSTIVPLMLGLTVVLCEDLIKKEVHSYLHYLMKSRINIIKLTPSYFKILLNEAKNNFVALPQLRSIILGGENLSSAECQSWLKLYPKHFLYNEYGPTEATVAVSTYKLGILNCTELDTNVPIGTMGCNMNCIILDTHGKPVPDGEPGELYIGGECLARGYLNQPQLTQQQFITRNKTRLYKTGDLCKKRPDEVIDYLGRIDEQVKIRGYRVEPGEIEKYLMLHPGIREVTLLTQKDSFGEQRLVAYYILKDNNNKLNTNQIRQFLQKQLPEYMLPSVFVRVDSFPLTANGKLDKAALPLPSLIACHNYVEPITALEKKLAQIWSDELGVPLIGVHDDFFDLGGHSLSAARIISKINGDLNRNVSIHDFYKATNIAKLAPIIKKTKKNKKKRSGKLPNYHKIINIPLSDFQFLLWMSNTFEPRAQKLNIVARKRLNGHLDATALEFAFQALLKKHETLNYQILKLKPAQKIQKNCSFKLIISDLTPLSIQESEHELQSSITQLINFYPWPKKNHLIIGKLFYLNEHESELQICIPHLISDDHCIDILFAELSQFYQHYNQITLEQIEIDTRYKEHIFSERTAMKMHLEEDILFWEEYLKDASLFTFPEEYVIPDMQIANIPYSTYSEIPRDLLTHLKHFCEKNHISINNALCGMIALVLRNCCGNQQSETPYTYINIIQSTRDNCIYDNTIGCFLRVEPTKISLDDKATLTSLSQQIRNAIIDTSNYQHCSNLVKLCSINSLKPNTIENFFTNLVTPLYTKLLKIPSFYRKILQRCGSRMISFKRNTKFLINLNIRDNFVEHPNRNMAIFGFDTKQIKNNNNDLLAINYIFEASFIRDDNQNAHYLVISANLQPAFREKISREVIQIMESIAFENNSRELILKHEHAEHFF
ncbi:non-ribosomal peptide synthetase [Legionella steigerwaltii]|uniref:Non-ribosomal peptide synthetase n=1 Tax=Legionella steigerwaltii TaxID=460 RepID=A0A378L6K7_9GAMM|nr:amino acid adenylation domain-containing protein [Legionella steigerwaltii]KTD77430.1 non-ribosomal peptide synthetase [Legionella steigerwaltii]STY22715.1 non-ribosomal peptide synthetase [Legionella steigerwaltii]